MTKKTVAVTLLREGAMCAIPLSFDPKPVFGKTRAPVKVTLYGYTYRSTIAKYGDGWWIPLRKSHREAAGLEGNETLTVMLELDEEKREVEPPADFVKALKEREPAWANWKKLSFTHQKEHVDALADAKRPETRARRLEKSVATITGK